MDRIPISISDKINWTSMSNKSKHTPTLLLSMSRILSLIAWLRHDYLAFVNQVLHPSSLRADFTVDVKRDQFSRNSVYALNRIKSPNSFKQNFLFNWFYYTIGQIEPLNESVNLQQVFWEPLGPTLNLNPRKAILYLQNLFKNKRTQLPMVSQWKN